MPDRGFPNLALATIAGIVAFLSAAAPVTAQCEVQGFFEPHLSGGVHMDDNVAVNNEIVDNGAGKPFGPNYVHVYRRHGLKLVYEQKVGVPEGYDEWGFGLSRHVHGDWLAVGDAHIEFGRVYVYRWTVPEGEAEGQWVHAQTLQPESGDTAGLFGRSLAIDGDRLLIGAPWWVDTSKNPNWTQVGRAYMYQFDGRSWELEQVLPNPDPNKGDGFGSSVVIVGTRAIIGAPGAKSYAGRVDVYELIRDEWAYTSTLTPDPPTQYGSMGGSGRIGATQDTIAAGAPMTGPHGRVYIFGPDETSWILYGEDYPIVKSAGNAWFGYAVDISEMGSDILAGTPNDDEAGVSAGAAFVLRLEDDEWVFQKKLIGSGVGPWDDYGITLTMAGDFALVGAHKAHLWAGILGEDCNESGQPDACDIFYGYSEDKNKNLIPDECEIFGDLNGDGKVDGADLGIFLSQWGDCPPPHKGGCWNCPADLNGDCVVDGADLGILLSNWG